MKRLSIWILEKAERFFLRTHGWRLEDSYWKPPNDYPFRSKKAYSRRHAVNAHRQVIYNPMHGGKRLEYGE